MPITAFFSFVFATLALLQSNRATALTIAPRHCCVDSHRVWVRPRPSHLVDGLVLQGFAPWRSADAQIDVPHLPHMCHASHTMPRLIASEEVLSAAGKNHFRSNFCSSRTGAGFLFASFAPRQDTPAWSAGDGTKRNGRSSGCKC